MAKKLIYNYTFDASAKTVAFTGLYKMRSIQMITNVTDNIIIYNFADPNKGATAAYNSTTNISTLTLAYDTTSMSDSDELQIFVDIQEDKIDFGETFVDPVNKLRISNPENLIDTDFEYGLQPTKWETVELVNNIPSVYTKPPGVSIPGISIVDSETNSRTITVSTTINHDLGIGDPIEVQGLSSKTANGKYIITAVPSDKKFIYKAAEVQSAATNIKTAYTTIIPGSFFTGSDIVYNSNQGIETDAANDSTLTFTTDYNHGFTTSTSFYITNTVGKKSLSVGYTGSTAPDGIVGIATTNNTIYLPNHNLYTGQTVYASAGSGGMMPATEIVPPQPTGDSTVQTIFDAVNTAGDTLMSNMGTTHPGGQHSRIYTSYGVSSLYAQYCTSNVNIDPYEGGDQQSQRIYYGDYLGASNRAYEIRCYNSGNSYQSYLWYTYGEGNTDIYTGLPVNVGSWFGRNAGNSNNPANLGTWGMRFISTLHEASVYLPYITTVWQLPNPSDISMPSLSGGHVRNWLSLASARYRKYNNRPSASSYDGYKYSYDLNANSDGWQWTSRSTLIFGNTAYSGTYHIGLSIWNTKWDGYWDGGTSSMYGSTTNNAYALMSYDQRYRGPRYYIEFLTAMDEDVTNQTQYGPTNATYAHQDTADSFVNTIVNQIKSDTISGGFSAGITTCLVNNYNNDRIILQNTSGVAFNLVGVGSTPITIETGQTTGVSDDYYTSTGVTSTTVSIATSSKLANRELTFDNTGISSSSEQYYVKINNGHGLTNGQKVVFDEISGASIAGLNSGSTYYASILNNDYLELSYTVDDWNSGISSITGIQTSAGSYKLTVPGIAGRVAAAGTVTTSTESKTVTGEHTKFLATYNVGDPFIVSGISTYDGYVEGEVASVLSDINLALVDNAGIGTTGAQHFIDTKLNIRADGEFIHRPFDGGVEITAGTSPESSIVRQTRKYFRYQSGKGIQCSMAINFNPSRPVRLAHGSGSAITMTTEYPHGLTTGDSIIVSGASDNAFNGTFSVTGSTDFTFTYTSGSQASEANPTGFINYTINGYSNAGIRGGLFDHQNGFFYEYDGSNVSCVRRSSTEQLSGTVAATKGFNTLVGSDTRFQDQLTDGDMIVIRGQSYRVTYVESQSSLHFQPRYRGISNTGIVITKTVDTRVPQSDWNIDKADGTGPSGYILDKNKIQMAYLDYSWYGAGKIRCGFKDTYGHVKYMHEFVHNNKLNEAYMRTGNIAARYEAYNAGGIPTFVPSLFHWGTSVIMDGGFDSDDSYLFTASGNQLTFTNGDSNSADVTADGVLKSERSQWYLRNYYLRLTFSISDSALFADGMPLYTSDGELTGETVWRTSIKGSEFYVDILIATSYSAPAIYPDIDNGDTIDIGAPSGGGDVNLENIPLISMRLAPSVDNNLIGAVGERDIINRMQLRLQEMGISVSHDSTISVVLNGALNNNTYTNVGSPSLSQYIAHTADDSVQGGTTIYQFRASGGAVGLTSERLVSSSTFDLSRLMDLGNSILGGDGVFPNGPDLITITATAIDTATINADSTYQVSSRISWSESQA